MNKTTVSKMIFGAVLLLFTACTQDELAEQGNTLPDGEYPLQIGSVSITAEASEEPWTRVAENETDGMGSHWTDGDKIGVRIGDNEETGIYIINVDDAGNVTVEPETPVYWKSTQTAEVTAWYPAEASSVNLGFQHRNGLTYVLHGTGTGNHQSPVTLGFTHQLAKVRVVTKGTAQVRNISIRNVPTFYTIEEGKITGQDTYLSDIPMLRVEREGIDTYWEASVGPGAEIKYFDLGGMNCALNTPVTTQAGALHTITWTVNNEGTTTIDLLNEDCIINDDGTYYFSGTASHAIRVTGGKPNIYLEDAQISVSGGNAIDIQGGSPTIHVRGEGNTITSSDKTGIFVAENSTVTITGNGREDKLTVRGGDGSSGIGGYLSREDPAPACGNIEIRSVWIEAYGSKSINYEVAPGIGGAGSASCGTITIDDATVYSYGIEAFPIGSSSAIGGGFDILENKGSFGAITIRNNSEVYVQRGDSYSDYIGNSGSMTYPETGDIVATVDETSTVTKLN
ncbi:fimbrillin family protein [uncultured Bacteroides sp.]|uniref:fimbrillin family protein n=1 Tax=uncultured Bacteroides sp. TaxID=162156 RepID=UPI00341D4B9A